ncbi:tripartite tricarboxylate transporter substrate-binding protein [Pseudorhodoferax sp.]|uniref:tripartite tricarboxylate transporter substrate-binding protein n=1 Tax=Pseudorhodoferax sp. TaxID=1993553 RepID=UPI002DD6688A|nr:tripartite tricarboxylate transporter substrate-binding protein [Pseudorhodoferax sp.]
MTVQRRSLLMAAAGLGATLIAPAARAQAATGEITTLVVPFTAGSGTDVIARLVGEQLSRTIGRQMIVDNRAGAGGTLGAALVAAAPGDGRMLLVHSAGHVANAALYPKLRYDTLKDFTPVALLATLPNVLVVSPASKIGSVAELVARARAEPGKMTYASAGNGSATHINAEKFRIAARLQAVHVPYRGTPPALMDVIGGQVDWFFAPLVSAMPLIQDGKLLPLAVGSAKRTPLLPQLPTTVEAGFAESDYAFWVGLFAPARMPAAQVATLAAGTAKVLAMPEIATAMAKLGAEPGASTQPQFAEFVAQDLRATTALVKQAGIRVD